MDQFEPFEFKEDWQEVGEKEKNMVHETYFQVQIIYILNLFKRVFEHIHMQNNLICELYVVILCT